MESKTVGGLPRGAVSVLESGAPLRYHQLFFDRMKLRRPESPARTYGRRRGMPPKPPPPPAARPQSRWVQPRLFEAHRDFTRFDESTDVDLTNPWLTWAIYLAYQRGEARGWRRGVRFAVRRGLTIVLSGHTAGEVVCWSELFPAMRAREIGTERVAEVLEEWVSCLTTAGPPSRTGRPTKTVGDQLFEHPVILRNRQVRIIRAQTTHPEDCGGPDARATTGGTNGCGEQR
jgi:hypothetical protein